MLTSTRLRQVVVLAEHGSFRRAAAALKISQPALTIGVAELSDAVLNEALTTELVGQHRARILCRPGHPLLTRARVSLTDLLEFPWANTRVPPRVAGAFPRPPGRAGHIDELTGDFVPAVELIACHQSPERCPE